MADEGDQDLDSYCKQGDRGRERLTVTSKGIMGRRHVGVVGYMDRVIT